MPPAPVPPSSIDPIRPRLDPEPTHRPEPASGPTRTWPSSRPTRSSRARSRPAAGAVADRRRRPGRLAVFDHPGVPALRRPELRARRGAGQGVATVPRDGDAATTSGIRARFQPDDAAALRDLYQLVGDLPGHRRPDRRSAGAVRPRALAAAGLVSAAALRGVGGGGVGVAGRTGPTGTTPYPSSGGLASKRPAARSGSAARAVPARSILSRGRLRERGQAASRPPQLAL